MAQYNYKAMDKNGKAKKGSIEAINLDKAKEKLKSEGLIVQDIKEQGAGKKGGGKKVKDKDLAVFCKQFSAVLNAGVTIISALEMMSEQLENKTLKRALQEAQAYVQKGGTLADAFKLNPKVFPPIMINMTAAGEMSGNLEICFDRLTTHFETANALHSKVKGAVTYPIVILIVVVAVVAVLLVGVIPQFSQMFDDLGSELPAATQMLVNLSNFLQHKWYILVIIVAAIVFGLKAFGKTEPGSLMYAKIGIKFPLFGNLTIKSAAATFSRTMATLMASGISLIDAVEQVAKMINNRIIREALLDAKTQIAKGVPLSKPLRDCGIFPPMLPQMTKIGEETGNIEDMMDKVADYYEMEVNDATDALTAAMEPLIIVIMGVVVGGIVMAIYSPMLSMYDAVDNY
ncbi:type II secretion system F family protein [Clostridium sp. AF15-6B]|jgi:type IV pilus assembly protein PilC|nr:type II secretion system F family protein [Clostridium sp. AF16-25]RGH03514.1 type II secretion system F family protein [Clostridium sp. AF15-49]RGH10295.1 type II secretion system F family protein [Clostridium sp. AF15-6B]RHS89827.1 type II secretion system F family protein [Clostridium sp. AM42-36]RHU88680.1 type II secretion system F family protein [Clostridium sp. OM08-29]HCS96714.1 type II secretion system F family protein [Lachnospiraceae bacterium]